MQMEKDCIGSKRKEVEDLQKHLSLVDKELQKKSCNQTRPGDTPKSTPTEVPPGSTVVYAGKYKLKLPQKTLKNDTKMKMTLEKIVHFQKKLLLPVKVQTARDPSFSCCADAPSEKKTQETTVQMYRPDRRDRKNMPPLRQKIMRKMTQKVAGLAKHGLELLERGEPAELQDCVVRYAAE